MSREKLQWINLSMQYVLLRSNLRGVNFKSFVEAYDAPDEYPYPILSNFKGPFIV